MTKKTTLSLALITPMLWLLPGCEESPKPAKAPESTAAPAEPASSRMPMLKTPIVVSEPAAPAAQEPPKDAGEGPVKSASSEPAPAAETTPQESASAEPQAAPAAEPQEAVTEAPETAATATPDTNAPESQNDSAVAMQQSLADVLISEAQRAGWSTIQDEKGNIFVVPPGTSLPSGH